MEKNNRILGVRSQLLFPAEQTGIEKHHLYRFEDVLNGFIDVSEDPPRVVVPKRS